MKKVSALMLMFLGMIFSVPGIFGDSTIKLKGQVRTRSTLSKSTVQDADIPLKNEIRSRLGAESNPAENITVLVEVQDSRNMGSEPHGVPVAGAHHTTTIGADTLGGVDLHQAFFKAGMGPVSIKAGRQKVKLGSQRFISSLEWHPNARVFDGATGVYSMGKNAQLTGVALAVKDVSPGAIEDYLALYGLHYQRNLSPEANLEVYYFHDISGNALGNYQLYNIGLRLHGAASLIFYEEEFQWQRGRKGGDKAAFYNATRVGVKLPGKIKIGLGFDMMSGSDDGSGEGTYVANYYFAHAYFGWMDRFIVNPATGVIDLRLDIDLPVNDKLTLKSQNHYFMQAAPVSGAEEAYGTELDLELHAKVFAKSKIVVGGGLLFPEAGLAVDDEAAFQVYLMPIFNF